MRWVLILFLAIFLNCAASTVKGGYGCGFSVCPVCTHDCYLNTHKTERLGVFEYEIWQCQYCNFKHWERTK